MENGTEDQPGTTDDAEPAMTHDAEPEATQED